MQLTSLYVKNESSESPSSTSFHIAGALVDAHKYLGYFTFPGKIKVQRIVIESQYPAEYSEAIFFIGEDSGLYREVEVIVPYDTTGGIWETAPEQELYIDEGVPLKAYCVSSGGIQYVTITLFYVYAE